MTTSARCGCCGESVWPLELRESVYVCLDCLRVYDSGRWHRWNQIRAISIATKADRRAVEARKS